MIREQFFDPNFSIPEVEAVVSGGLVDVTTVVDGLRIAAYTRAGLTYPESLDDSLANITKMTAEMLANGPYPFGWQYTFLEWSSADLIQGLSESDMIDQPELMTETVKTARDIAVIVLVKRSTEYMQPPLGDEVIAIFKRLGIDTDDIYDTIMSGVSRDHAPTLEWGADRLKNLSHVTTREWLEVWTNVLAPMARKLLGINAKTSV